MTSDKNIISLVAVVAVKDQEKALAWYKNLFGREADIEPFENVAEWQMSESAWVQVLGLN